MSDRPGNPLGGNVQQTGEVGGDMEVTIGGRAVGSGHPALIVAELSANHNGSLERAVDTIRRAAASGADAVKLQTYTADTLTIDCDGPDFIVPGTGPWSGRTLYDLYDQAHTPWEWHEELFQVAQDEGIQVFSTPFDESAVAFLEDLEAPAYKIASFELVDDRLLRAVAATGKPVILSTGMADLEEIGHALSVLREANASEIVLLWCTSSYPAPDKGMDLASIPVLGAASGCLVGLSDHSMGTVAAVVAVTLGACVIEKHLTLDRASGGVDSHFSLEPDEFLQLVRDVRRAEAMMGHAGFQRSDVERESMIFRRSLYVVRDMKRGERFDNSNVRAIRPGYGLSPRHLGTVFGLRAALDVKRGTPFAWDLVGGDSSPE
jgi:pseudaminic acid synthase